MLFVVVIIVAAIVVDKGLKRGVFLELKKKLQNAANEIFSSHSAPEAAKSLFVFAKKNRSRDSTFTCDIQSMTK